MKYLVAALAAIALSACSNNTVPNGGAGVTPSGICQFTGSAAQQLYINNGAYQVGPPGTPVTQYQLLGVPNCAAGYTLTH
jgi:hypothetical protein